MAGENVPLIVLAVGFGVTVGFLVVEIIRHRRSAIARASMLKGKKL